MASLIPAVREHKMNDVERNQTEAHTKAVNRMHRKSCPRP